MSSDIYIESLILGHGFLRAVSSHVIFSNMSRVVAVFFQSLGYGNGRGGNVFTLERTLEPCFFLRYAWLFIAIQNTDDIDPIVNSGRVLTGEHRCPRRGAIGLGIGMGEAQAPICDFLNIGSDEATRVSTHRDLVSADLVPAQVIDHVYDQIGFLIGKKQRCPN